MDVLKLSRKYLVLLLAVLFVLSAALTGCADNDDKGKGGNDTGNKDNTEENNDNDNTADADDELYVLGEEELELTMFGNYDWYTMPAWGDDEQSAWMKENYKVDIKGIDGGGNAAQKLSTMQATDDYPDFIWTDKGSDVEKLREAGKLVALDDYLDKYPNLKEWFSEDGLNMLRSEDGKLYQFPNWYNSEPFGNSGYVVNKKIYEDLGSPDLNTPDDLYNFLKDVKENYPDITPFETNVDAQGVNVLYSAFAEGQSPANIRIHAVPEGDKFTSIFGNEDYVESLKFSSKLFREGLMTQDAFTQDEDTVKAKVTSGQVAVYAAASPTEMAQAGHDNMRQDDPDAGYFMIWPIANEGVDKDKVHPGSYEMLGWNVAVIPVNEKDPDRPEKVFAFLDWLTGPEAQSIQNFGIEGKYWDGYDDEGFTNFTQDYVDDPEGVGSIPLDTTNHQWVGNSNFLDTGKAKFTAELPVEQRNWTTHQQWEITWPTQKDQTDYFGLDPMPDSPEGEIQQHINDIAEEARAKAVHAESDEEVEKIMAKAEEDAQNVGIEQLLEFKAAKWQENLEKLGW